MTDLFQQSSQKLDAAITEIQHAIATGLANKQRLFETMRQLYGEGSANGTWSQRDAFDCGSASEWDPALREAIALFVMPK